MNQLNMGQSKDINKDVDDSLGDADNNMQKHSSQAEILYVKKNTVYNMIRTFSTIVFPLITFPYNSRVLQVESIGKLNFGSSIISYISLIASLGINTYAIRECSRVKRDRNELDNTASEIFSINIITTIIAYIILACLLTFWGSLHGYEVLIIIQSISILFATLGADWLNSAMEDFRYITIRTVCFQLISVVSLFVFVHKPEDYYICAIISVISSSGANLLNIFYRRRYCKVSFTKHINWKRHMPPVILLFSMLIAQTIFVNVDTTMLGLIRNDMEVGWYSTSTKIYTMVNQVVASIALVVMPQLSLYFRENNFREINRLLKYAFNFITVVGFPCLVGLFTMAPEIIELIGGTEYLPAVPSLRILVIALAFSFYGGWIGNIILLPSGQEKVMLMICIVSAVVNFVTNIFLIPEWGLNAAAFTTALSQALAFFLGIPFISKHVNIGNILKIVLSPIIGSVAVALIVLLSQMYLRNLWIRSIIAVIFSGITYLFILVLMKNEFAMDIIYSVKRRITRK